MKKYTENRAFTLIELLVVVAIIGTLAAVILASLGGARESAQISRMVSDLNQIERAFQLWGSNEGWTQWPTQYNQRSLSYLVSNTEFGEYLPQAPESPFGDAYHLFGITNSTGDNCSPDSGVYIYVENTPIEQMRELDSIIDNTADLACGKIRQHFYDSDELKYMLSNSDIF